MKRNILIIGIALISLTSCKKTWQCEMNTTYMGKTTTSHFDLKCTKAEMEEQIKYGTKTGVITQTTECR